MNREILLRGITDDGELVYPDDKSFTGLRSYDILQRFEKKEQYIGVADRNDKKIFEGDKVEWMNCVFVVEWDEVNCCFYGKRDPNNELRGDLSAISFPNSTVIGSIHDN